MPQHQGHVAGRRGLPRAACLRSRVSRVTSVDVQVPRPCVLVIDDEESLRLSLAKGLTRLGFETVPAANGTEGVQRFRAGGIDAVLTDVRLPDLSGLDVVAVLTEVDAQVPVVVMTGFGTLDTALEALRRGAKDYVAKPFAVEDVGRVLARAVGERRLVDENRRLRALVERRFAPGEYQQVEATLAAQAPVPPTAGPEPSEGVPQAQHASALPLREAQRRFEQEYVRDLLDRTGGNVAAAAQMAGISRPNFHKKLRALGVEASGFRQASRRARGKRA